MIINVLAQLSDHMKMISSEDVSLTSERNHTLLKEDGLMGKRKLNVKWRENVMNDSAFIQFILLQKHEVGLLSECLELGNFDGMFEMSGTGLVA